MGDESFYSIITEDGQNLYVFTESELGKTICIQVVEGPNNAWVGTLTREDVKKHAGTVNLSPDAYTEKVLSAFTGKPQLNHKFSYQLIPSKTADSCTLVWKKIHSDDVKFKLGQVSLKSTSVEDSLKKLFDWNITKVTTLERKLEEAQTNYDVTTAELTRAVDNLENCVREKHEMENTLYRQFVELLNAKKEKIRHLKQGNSVQSSSLKGNSAKIDDSVSSSLPVKHKPSTVQQGRSPVKQKRGTCTIQPGPSTSTAMSDDEYGYDTEEETPRDKSTRKLEKCSVQVNSSVVNDFDDLEFDSPVSIYDSKPSRNVTITKDKSVLKNVNKSSFGKKRPSVEVSAFGGKQLRTQSKQSLKKVEHNVSSDNDSESLLDQM